MSVGRLVLLVVKLCVFVLLSAIAMNDLIAAKVFFERQIICESVRETAHAFYIIQLMLFMFCVCLLLTDDFRGFC